MKLNEHIKRFNRALARQFLFAFTWLFQHVSYGFIQGFANVFIFVGYLCIPYQKNVARESLKIAFGNEKTDEEIDAIVKKCFSNLGRGMIELIYMMEHPEMIKERVT